MLFDTLLLFSNLFRSGLMYFATTSRSSDQASPLATLLFGMRSIDNRTSSVSENISYRCNVYFAFVLLSVHNVNIGLLCVCD